MIRVCLIALFGLLPLCSSFGASPSDDVKKELMQANELYEQAILHQDAAAHDRLLSDDYIFINDEGTMQKKADVLKDVNAGNYKFEVAKSDALLLRVYGDAAVLTGQWTEKGSYKGEAFDKTDLFTTVFAKIDGNWRVVSDHLSQIKPSSAE